MLQRPKARLSHTQDKCLMFRLKLLLAPKEGGFQIVCHGKSKLLQHTVQVTSYAFITDMYFYEDYQIAIFCLIYACRMVILCFKETTALNILVERDARVENLPSLFMALA